MAFFSIIIPTRNCEKTIITCLSGIARQKFQDFELIIMDGSSSDRTIPLIKTFLSENAGLAHHFVSGKDDGIYDAMNKGAAQATGEWFHFLGADDAFVDDTVLLRVHSWLQKSPKTDLLYGNALINTTGELYAGRFSKLKLLRMNICHQAIFVARNTFLELGPFNTRYELYADWDLNLKIFFGKKRILYKNIVVVSYSNTGKSSETWDHVFEKDLKKFKNSYYSNPVNRFKSRIHYMKKKLKRLVGKRIKN